MDVPNYEHFPSQSWESWHDIHEIDETTDSGSQATHISFDADNIVMHAVAQRGNSEDRRSLGLQA